MAHEHSLYFGHGLLLKIVVDDWGPRPFRVMDWWHQEKNFRRVVKSEWSSMNIQGWAAFVLKEKLKGLKEALGCWSKENEGDLKRRPQDIMKKINEMDIKEEESRLSKANI